MAGDPLDDPLDRLRAAAARSREATATATADLRRQRTAIEREHRADPSYGTARRTRERNQNHRCRP